MSYRSRWAQPIAPRLYVNCTFSDVNQLLCCLPVTPGHGETDLCFLFMIRLFE